MTFALTLISLTLLALNIALWMVEELDGQKAGWMAEKKAYIICCLKACDKLNMGGV